MELSNEFTVDVPLEEAWTVLTDVRRIAPCMPGATLEEVDGDEYRGAVKVKVGPITAEYKGKAHFVEQDVAAHRAVLRAEGRETRGQGAANATITATLESSGSGTRVSVVTDLALTGRVAQFGRGVLADVSNKLLGQFVDSLETTVLGDAALRDAALRDAAPGDAAPGPTAGNAGESATEVLGVTEVRPPGEPGPNGDGHGAGALPPGREAVPVNLFSVVGPALLKRAAFPVAVVLALWIVRVVTRRRPT